MMKARPILPAALMLGMFFGIPTTARATPPEATVPTTTARSPATHDVRVDRAITHYNHWLDQIAEHDDVAGLATAVVVDGHVRYERTLGYADTTDSARITPNTVFRIASLSKAFASAMAGLLVDSGRLHWDTRLVKVLPFFELNTSTATQQATVADILGQRLGLPRNAYDRLLETNVPYPKLARELNQVQLRCPVGSCYSYQNIAFSLIGDVIHAKTESFYAHEVEKRLFLPLGMTSATYGLKALEKSASWARPHWRTHGGWKPFMPRPAYYHVAPAAGVNASLRDMEQWLLAQMGARPDVLPHELLKKLHTPGVDTPGETRATPWRRTRVDAAHYALGWRVYNYAGHTLVFHAGAVRGYRAMIGFVPDQKVGMVILWNCASARPAGLMPMFLDRLLGLSHRDWAGLKTH
jgi:beta-lactamase class C